MIDVSTNFQEKHSMKEISKRIKLFQKFLRLKRLCLHISYFIVHAHMVKNGKSVDRIWNRIVKQTQQTDNEYVEAMLSVYRWAIE